MVNPSMVKPLGLSSERDEFKRRQVVTRLRSVTLLCRMIFCVVCDFNGYPYRAVTYATQKIIRQSNVTERSLVTTCRLLNSSRSDDNPNGFTIEGFTIIENKDLQTIKR